MNVPRLVVAMVLGLAGALAVPGPAVASCAEQPVDSPYAFVGTVVGLEKEGRVANVVLDDGNKVVVHGSPELGDAVATSVDRRYALGGRYEFHPINARTPFQDNACTATRQLAGPATAPVEPAQDLLPGWLPVDEQAGPAGYAGFGGLALAVLAAAATLIVLGRRAVARRDRSPRRAIPGP